MQFKRPTSLNEIVTKMNPLIEDSLGDLNVTVSNFSSVESADSGSFIFVMNQKKIENALNSEAACILAPLQMKEKIQQLNSNKNFLFSKNPELAARNVKTAFVFSTPYKDSLSGIHSTAVVAESAEISLGVTIGPHAFVGENCRLGEGVFIGASSVVEANVTIGNQSTIHPLSYIGHSCLIGNDCEIMPQAIVGSEGFGYAHDHLGNHYRVPHTGRVILEDDVHIGAATAIDRGTLDDTVIKKGTKIDNQCHLAHNSIVGKNGLITAQFVNAGSATIGDNFMCGGKSVVAGHTNVTDNVHMAGLSVAANDVTEPGQYGGYPLQPLKAFLKSKATSVHLPQMRKDIKKLLKKVFPEDN